MAPEAEELLVLGRPEAVQQHGGAACAGRPFGQQFPDHQRGQLFWARSRHGADAWLPVDAEPYLDHSVRDGKQRGLGPRQGAASERDPDGAGAVVGQPGQPLDLGQCQALLGGGAGNLEHHQVAGHSPAPLARACIPGGYVVGDNHRPAVDPLGPQPVLGQAEVQPVPRVVPVAEKDSRAGIEGPAGAVGLLGRGGREDFADHGRVQQAGSDHAHERRVVPRSAAADHRDLARDGPARPHHGGGVRHRLDVPAVRGGEAGHGIGGERRWASRALRHDAAPPLPED